MWERRQKGEPSEDQAPCWPGPGWTGEIEDHENGEQANKKKVSVSMINVGFLPGTIKLVFSIYLVFYLSCNCKASVGGLKFFSQ